MLDFKFCPSFRPVLVCETVAFQSDTKILKNKERDIIAKRENSKLTAVLFSYVGTSEEFNQFLRAMLKDYLTDGEPCPEKSFEDDET